LNAVSDDNFANACHFFEGMCEIFPVESYDISAIPGLNFHPACVVLVALSNLKIEAYRTGNRESFPREASPSSSNK